MDEQVAWETIMMLGGLAVVGFGILAGVVFALVRQISRDKLV